MNAEITSDVISDTLYRRYLAALLAGDRATCALIVRDLVAAGVGLRNLYLRVFQRSLYETGELWEHQRISVAVEHLATAITERMMSLVQAQTFGGEFRDRSVIIACVAAEYHQLVGRMVADLCELRGWRGYFLGANTPLPDLLRLIELRRPTVVGLSLSIFFHLPELLKALDALGGAYPDLPILVGGQAFRWGGLGAVQAYSNVSYIASPEELEERMLAYEQ